MGNLSRYGSLVSGWGLWATRNSAHRASVTEAPSPRSGGMLVLVDQPAQDIPTPHVVRMDGRRLLRGRLGHTEVESPVGTSPVVMGHVTLQGPLQVTPALHQNPVQALLPDGPNEPFRVRVGLGGSDRGGDHPHPLGPEQ